MNSKGGRVRYMLNGFEENLNYILDSTNAVEVAREGSKEGGDLVIYFETKDDDFAKGGKISKDEAIVKAMRMGVDFNKDFHAQSYGNELSELARETGYRKSKSSSGSLGRAFFEHLEKRYDKMPEYYDNLSTNDMFSKGGKLFYNLGRGIYRLDEENQFKRYDRKKEIDSGYPNAREVLSSTKEASDYVDKLNDMKPNMIDKLIRIRRTNAEIDLSDDQHPTFPNRAIRYNDNIQRYEIFNYITDESDYSDVEIDNILTKSNEMFGTNFAKGGVITIGSSSHYTQEAENKKAFNLLNDKLISDKSNPLYDEFQEEKLYLDDTNGFVSIVGSVYDDYMPTDEELKDFTDYLKGFLSMDSKIYIKDRIIDYNNYLKYESMDSYDEFAKGGEVSEDLYSSQEEEEKGKTFKKYKVLVFEKKTREGMRVGDYPFAEFETDNILDAMEFGINKMKSQRAYRDDTDDMYVNINQFVPIRERKGNPIYAYDNLLSFDEEDLKRVSPFPFEKGGSTKSVIADKQLRYDIFVTNTNNPNKDNRELVASVKAKGDALLMVSALNNSVKEAPLQYFMEEKFAKGGMMPLGDMIVLESIGTAVCPKSGMTYAILKDGKNVDPDTETDITEIDVTNFEGTNITDEDLFQFLKVQKMFS